MNRRCGELSDIPASRGKRLEVQELEPRMSGAVPSSRKLIVLVSLQIDDGGAPGGHGENVQPLEVNEPS